MHTLAKNSFLRKFDKIVFDMDGVITSEQTYWDIVALTVYEMLLSSRYFGTEAFDAAAAAAQKNKIRKAVFCDDAAIFAAKNIGVNSNWDFAYILLGLLAKHKTYAAVLAYLQAFDDGVDQLYEAAAEGLVSAFDVPHMAARRCGDIWNQVVDCFQAWYEGRNGKPAMADQEVPLLDNEKLHILFGALKGAGIKLAIATGRPGREMRAPLRLWNMEQYFEADGMISYDDVQRAQALADENGILIALAKPHPYCFLKAVLGCDYDDFKIIQNEYAITEPVLVVGDAGADILAAKQAGFAFLGVLSGADADNARRCFKEQAADYVFDDLTCLLSEVAT